MTSAARDPLAPIKAATGHLTKHTPEPEVKATIKNAVVLLLDLSPTDLEDSFAYLKGKNHLSPQWWKAYKDEVIELRKKKRTNKEGRAPTQGTVYVVQNGALCFVKATQDGDISVPLCNFSATIVAETTYDDGLEQKTVYEIQGNLQGGGPLPSLTVQVNQYNSMNWTSGWGHQAVVYAGFSTRDHTRCAIQLLSQNVSRSTVYAHLGFRLISGEWVYLHGGGAIGENGPVPGVQVSLREDNLIGFSLPEPPVGKELSRAVRASLNLRHLAPATVILPLLAAVYQAVLAECRLCDHSIHITGQTGVQKTEIAAIAQSHYGSAFNSRKLPAGWESTENFLEKLAFLTKDSLLVVDDFAPRGASADVQRLYRKADRLMRGQANRAGRGRMRSDASLRPTYRSRSLIVSTGEDIPTGHSLRARLVIVEVQKGDVDLTLLTQAQQSAAEGIFAQAMAAYVKWLAPRLDELKDSLSQEKRRLSDELRPILAGNHDKTPDNIASLLLGARTFIEFAANMQAISPEEAENLEADFRSALLEVGKEQERYHKAEDPVDRFITILGSAIASGRAHVADDKDETAPEDPGLWGWRELEVGVGERQRTDYRPQGERVGWTDGDNLFLDPDAAYTVAQKMARDQGSSLSLRPKTLWRRLVQRRVLATWEENRSTVRQTINGTRRRVLHFLASKFQDDEDHVAATHAFQTEAGKLREVVF